jgi:DNA-binding MarR family transcriptional regulator
MDLNQKIRQYLLYLKQCDEVDAKYNLDTTEIKLLNEIATALLAEDSLTVSGALALKKIASPATLHATMKRLIVKNLIAQVPAQDSRTKYLNLSKLGWKRYSELSAISPTGAK